LICLTNSKFFAKMRKNRSLTTATGLVIPTLKCLPIAALLLAGMTACSDDDMPGGNELDVPESAVTVGNDPAAQANRITFYGTPGGRATSTAADFPSVGKEPQIPEGIPSFDSPNAAQQGQGDKTNYKLTGGQGQIEVYGGNVYITGDVKTHNINGSGGTIYVMSGAKLTLESGFNNQQAKIVVFGEIETEGSVNIGYNGQILVDKNLAVKGELKCEGTVVVKEELVVDGKLNIKNSGRVKGKCIIVNSNDSERAVDMSAGGVLAVRSHIYCEGMYLGSDAKVFLWPNSMAEVTGITSMTTNTCGFYYHSSEGKTGIHTLLNTNQFHVEGGADWVEYIGGLFKNELKIKYKELTNCNPAYETKFVPSADDYYIPSDVNHGGCNPGNGKEDENKPFDPIAIIDGPTHSHNHLSATCIQPAEDGVRAYVSYHLNTEYKDNAEWEATSVHMGCVELYNVTENQAEISSWLMNQDFDFNHLIVDGGKVYTVGDTKKYGATFGVIDLDGNGAFGKYEMGTDGREGVMKYYNLYKKTEDNRGSSGNCIIRDGNFFRIASYQGFQTMNVSDLTINNDAFLATSGSAKHIAKGGNYIVTLNLDQKGVTSSIGTVNVYTTWGTPAAAPFKTEAITPIDGKNVIATDGKSIYVALGETGVAKYSMAGVLEGSYSWIAEKQETNPNYDKKPLANGLDIDDKYVYVANGAAGMIVLDKTTMKRVARYSHTYKNANGKTSSYSANYVRKVGNLIYIAYGRDGLEIVKMREDAK